MGIFLSVLLRDVHLPVDALQCRNPLCVNSEHVSYIHRYATDFTEACLAAAERVLPKTNQGHSKKSLDGTNLLDRPAKSHYFGMTSGPMLDVLRPVY